MIRFGKKTWIWRFFKVFDDRVFELLFSIWKNFEPILSNVHCCKWPKWSKPFRHQVTLTRDNSMRDIIDKYLLDSAAPSIRWPRFRIPTSAAILFSEFDWCFIFNCIVKKNENGIKRGKALTPFKKIKDILVLCYHCSYGWEWWRLVSAQVALVKAVGSLSHVVESDEGLYRPKLHLMKAVGFTWS